VVHACDRRGAAAPAVQPRAPVLRSRPMATHSPCSGCSAECRPQAGRQTQTELCLRQTACCRPCCTCTCARSRAPAGAPGRPARPSRRPRRAPRRRCEARSRWCSAAWPARTRGSTTAAPPRTPAGGAPPSHAWASSDSAQLSHDCGAVLMGRWAACMLGLHLQQGPPLASTCHAAGPNSTTGRCLQGRMAAPGRAPAAAVRGAAGVRVRGAHGGLGGAGAGGADRRGCVALLRAGWAPCAPGQLCARMPNERTFAEWLQERQCIVSIALSSWAPASALHPPTHTAADTDGGCVVE